MSLHCARCSQGTKVIDTRFDQKHLTIRRRRQCLYCGFRFTTLELDIDQIEGLSSSPQPAPVVDEGPF